MKEKIKKSLWEMWGSRELPAEWDGKINGGGKGGQRFWEYFWVLDNLDYLRIDRLLDVGAGNLLFFPKLISSVCEDIWAIDPDINESCTNNQILKTNLSGFIEKHEDLTFDIITCISVLEHMPEQEQISFCADLDRFTGSTIILTFEFGKHPSAWNYQLNIFSVYKCLNEFKNHYMNKIEQCPVWCENSNNGYWRPLGIVLKPM